MPDKIHLDSIEVWTRIGVPEAERSKPQKITISVTLEFPLGRAGRSDDLRHSIDYYEVYQMVHAFAQQGQRHLLENFAEELASLILKKYRVQAVSVEACKFILPLTRHVSVMIRRARAK